METLLINQDQLRAILAAFAEVNGVHSQAFTLEQASLGSVKASFSYSDGGTYAERYTHRRTVTVNRYGLTTITDEPLT